LEHDAVSCSDRFVSIKNWHGIVPCGSLTRGGQVLMLHSLFLIHTHCWLCLDPRSVLAVTTPADLLTCLSGYLTPYFFISVFTRDKNPEISPFLSTVPILVMNYSAAIGRILVGLGADKFGPVNTFMFSILVSGLTQVLIWDFASSLGSILVFAVSYGFWGGVVISLLTPAAAQLFGHDQLASLSGLLFLSNLPGTVDLQSIRCEYETVADFWGYGQATWLARPWEATS